MNRDFIKIVPSSTAQVVIVGGGVAGVWTALKLARSGIKTLLIHYSGKDRGGLAGSTIRSVGAINTAAINHENFQAYIDEMGLGQANPGIANIIGENLQGEIDELRSITELKDIRLGLALSNSDASAFIQELLKRFEAHGGLVMDAWVTRIIMKHGKFVGLQYQQDATVGKILAPVLILASGGYSGLFDGSVKNYNYGTLFGKYLEAGGLATNIEFVFKHGYGKPDFGALTPTEELPGVEVYDSDGEHVEWLERELYEGRGTANHLEAFKQWRRNRDKVYFIDMKFSPLFQILRKLNAEFTNLKNDTENSLDFLINEVVIHFNEAKQHQVKAKLQAWLKNDITIGYDQFNELKQYFTTGLDAEIFRVRQISYFSMGGAANLNCATNLPNVFVIGEAMHDFGAHRVGGMPWALYLASAKLLADTVIEYYRDITIWPLEDFELIEKLAEFDAEMLKAVQQGLYHHQECDFNAKDSVEFIQWLRNTRKSLLDQGKELDDAVAWLTVAESIMQASLSRRESRGCFYRSDYPVARDEMGSHFSCTSYDKKSNMACSEMIRVVDYPSLLKWQIDSTQYQVAKA